MAHHDDPHASDVSYGEILLPRPSQREADSAAPEASEGDLSGPRAPPVLRSMEQSVPFVSQGLGLSESPSDSVSSLAEYANPSPDSFASKFRRVRACARCHRLKMRCVFEDPTFTSCVRCFKSGIPCSMTEDPTERTARARPRKSSRSKQGQLEGLDQAISQASKYLVSVQRDLEEEHRMDESQELSSMPMLDLSPLQTHLTTLQYLISHVKSLQGASADSTIAFSASSMKDGPIKPVPSLPYIPAEVNIVKELFRTGLLSEPQARAKYVYFRENLLASWPCVSLPKQYDSFDYLLSHQPLMLLAFVAVTCLDEPQLHDTLLYYLDTTLARKTGVTGEITVDLIPVYLTLSLWCSPPKKWGSYKHQMSLMMALNISLCLDLGNGKRQENVPALVKDSSHDRKILRAYMGVYACCCSLGLSLPRFKVVSWTPGHQRCCELLLMGDCSPADRFICYYARIVALGEEIFQFLCPNTPNRPNWDNHTTPANISHETLRSIMIDYERRMQRLAVDSGLFNADVPLTSMLSIIYYQLLMTMYDYVVCKVLLKKDLVTDVYMQTLLRLVKASKKVIQSFISLTRQTTDFPTFFYYRPMHALVALIRARLLVKTQSLTLEVDVEQQFDLVSAALAELSKHSKVGSRMSVILTRIQKWMKVSSKFNHDGATNSMVDLLNELGNEKAVESIRINLKRKREGDDSDLRPDSKIRFINYSQQSIAEKVGSFIPSPIGYSDETTTPGDVVAPPESQPLLPTESDASFRQQQNLLNDLFSQIDSDLMNYQVNDNDLAFGTGRKGSFSAVDFGFW